MYNEHEHVQIYHVHLNDCEFIIGAWDTHFQTQCISVKRSWIDK